MVEKKAVLRIIDANLNRGAEALRVVEEYARFVLEHPGLTSVCKSMRHRLRAAVGALGAKTVDLLGARDTEGDVGTVLTDAGERRRADLDAVLRANFQRLAQSLRALEEYAKVLGKDASTFESLRYDAYTLEKQFASPPERPAVLDDKPLMVLVDDVRIARKVLEGGCRLLQYRDKTRSDAERLRVALELRALTREFAAVLIVNDRPDIALASGADGVHLGQDDLPIEAARKVLGPSKLIGLTAHSIEELKDCETRGADYIGVGTMFASPTKPDLVVKGPADLIPATKSCSVPCYAIGGITRENLDELLKLGATRLAVGSGITAADSVEGETRWFLSRTSSSGAWGA
jgi:thiamine-phosphate pyrophosphorylase